MQKNIVSNRWTSDHLPVCMERSRYDKNYLQVYRCRECNIPHGGSSPPSYVFIAKIHTHTQWNKEV